ncbi:enoyl-CoA hydratase [Mycolicibacterium sp. CH28]|uniref:enoyl-CoA hydratase/isomerase family protein n=1 Tax=Mycolicibacterium sp. CH28 TaxID=2512237 RepID=UPI0010809483|nr:enoyl-CoA hydratase-related protein [Mycolicibacterium sp. CH28]TGD89134.1 enoyl-CoA hydratase [Mycolicibacterium sp. CH28]
MSETSVSAVTYTVDSGVATIILNRPDVSNALTRTVKGRLLQACSSAASDPTVRAVTLLAAGKNFCVGQDLGEHIEALHADPARAMDTVREHYNPIVRALHAIEVPVVVGVNGACVGAGFGLALAGDIRIAGVHAKFGTAFTAIGLAADSGLSASLTRLVGPGRATAMFMCGNTVDAEAAHSWGIVDRVVPDDDVRAEAAALATRLAAGPTAAYRAVKRLIAANSGVPMDAVLDAEAAVQEQLGASVDHAAAVEAFLAKQRPTFVGH